MKSKMTLLFVLLSSVAHAEMVDTRDEYYAAREIAVMQANANGTYDVVCTNGNRETVTALDLELNNVCPNRTSTMSTGILSIQRISDNKFSVVCKDFTRMEATSEEIISGKLCPLPPVKLEDGMYKVTEGYGFCPQKIEAKHEGSALKEVKVTIQSPCSGGSFTMKCKDATCEGTYDYNFVLEVLSDTSYSFTNKDYPSRKSTFKKN